jgi:hypothetical protein
VRTTSQVIPAPPSRPVSFYQSRAAATLAEERREVFESVFQSLCRESPDEDRMAACSYLLRHLSLTSV